MCAICVLWEKEKLTRFEAQQALLEFIQTEQIDIEHQLDIADMIIEGKDNVRSN